MNTRPIIRLHLFFARDAPCAVILRQGPSKVFRMILWNTDNDTFEDGQWLRHKVYPERCSISPDGKHFMYFALNGKRDSKTEGSYTAISHPPYFTALALYPQGDTWDGGGVFVGNDLYIVNTYPDTKDIIGRAKNLTRVFQVKPTRQIATGIVLADGSRAPLSRELRLRILEGDDWRSPLDRYDTQGGVLYRREGLDLRPIRDFTEMSFEQIRAPYDTRDGEEVVNPWHPLDQEEGIE